jgi:hypothetical protein
LDSDPGPPRRELRGSFRVRFQAPVLVAQADDVLTITLNRPEQLNALNHGLLDAFDAAFQVAA